MGTRLELQSLLEELLGSRNVYYNPPESFKMNYPAIKYSLSAIRKDSANNKGYLLRDNYDLIVISKESDPPVVKKLLSLPYTSLSRPYKSDNLNHYPISIFY